MRDDTARCAASASPASRCSTATAGSPGYRGIARDVTQSRRAEERIRRLAHFDELTGLPNRTMFMHTLQRAFSLAQRRGKQFALFFIDLDRFKNINDSLGHEAGDRLLQDVAHRLRQNLRESDTVARLGGDEFVVLVEDCADARELNAIAQNILTAVGRPYLLSGQEYHVTGSIGISTYPADGQDPAALLKNADIAMYLAKDRGKNNFQFYSPQQNAHSFERLALESALRHALERDEFVLHYQPKVEIASGRIVGVEALLRWSHPDLAHGGAEPVHSARRGDRASSSRSAAGCCARPARSRRHGGARGCRRCASR